MAYLRKYLLIQKENLSARCYTIFTICRIDREVRKLLSQIASGKFEAKGCPRTYICSNFHGSRKVNVMGDVQNALYISEQRKRLLQKILYPEMEFMKVQLFLTTCLPGDHRRGMGDRTLCIGLMGTLIKLYLYFDTGTKTHPFQPSL